MKKLTARTLIGVALVVVAAVWLGGVFAQSPEEDDLQTAAEQGGGDVGGGDDNPIARALSRLVHDGVITQAQAEAVASQVLPVVHEMSVKVKHQNAHERLEGMHERIHKDLKVKVPGKPKDKLKAAQHRLPLELLGLGPKELQEKIAHGESVASIGETLGIPVECIVATLLGAIDEHLAMAVREGDLTGQEAAERLETARGEILEHVLSGG